MRIAPHPGSPRQQHRAPLIALFLLSLLSFLPSLADASNRWDLLRWCRSDDARQQALCEGMIRAALDLTTHRDFTKSHLCFPANTTLEDLRFEILSWLEEHRVSKAQSGLALVGEALRERYACSRSLPDVRSPP